MKTLALLSLACLLTSCAHTRFYDRRTGHLIADFQGDMEDSDYADGPTRWKSGRVSHSSATRAGTDAITKVAAAAGAAGLLLK